MTTRILVTTLPVLTLLLSTGCTHTELVETGVNAPFAERCGECHIAIYKEWERSSHARSFANREFKEATYGYRFEFCLGCHAPVSIHTAPVSGKQSDAARPTLRQANREEGVNCNGCHLTEDCKLAGPLPGMAPHPISETHQLYKRSVLCGTCHEGTYSEWQEISEKDKKSCQDCHMPALNRKLIQDAPWRWLYRSKPIKRHTFSREDGLKALDKPIRITLKEINTDGSSAAGIIELENLSVLHSIPTGDYGYNEAVLIIEMEDSNGQKDLLKEESFFGEMDTALKYGEKRAIKFSVPDGKNGRDFRLIVTLLKRSFDGTIDAVLAETSIPVRLPSQRRKTL